MKNLDKLNPEQQKAVLTTEGPVLILAGAGSGKTRTLTHRIAYLIEQKMVNPEYILAVTFTNKAAQEMLFRASKLINQDIETDRTYPFFQSNQPAFGTFHSICAKIIRSECETLGYKPNFAIYDTSDQLKLIKEILKKLNYDDKKYKPRAIISVISQAKNTFKNYETVVKEAESPVEEAAGKVFKIYQETLLENNAMDFDDLLVKTVELFEKDLKTLNYYQSLWKYIHVDEYQDTNYVQYKLIKLLAEKHKNICVVGDPDQSIYGWRGADIKNILDFEKDYKDIKTIKLEQNYRSTKKILEAAHNIIVKNGERKEKKLWTDNEDGDNIQLVKAEDERHEGDMILQKIDRIIKTDETVDLNDLVILYRTNAQSRSLEEACLRYAVPYRIIGGVKFYERKEIKDVLAYLKISVNPADVLSLKRVINVPARGIGQKSWEKLEILSTNLNIPIIELIENIKDIKEFSPKIKNSLENFGNLIKVLKSKKNNTPISDLLEYIFEETGLKNHLDDDTSEGYERIENVEELKSVAQKYDYLDSELGLLNFLQEISLLSDADTDTINERKLTLMTMHMAKGLEFEYVFIAGAEEKLFPHERSKLDFRQLEEERRIAYVCVTRAKKGLYFFYTKKRMIYGMFQYNEPSRFLSDIPGNIIDGDIKFRKFNEDFKLNIEDSQIVPETNFEPIVTLTDSDLKNLKDGDKVSHPKFGIGAIVSKSGDIATIAFEGKGIKKMALSIAPLQRI